MLRPEWTLYTDLTTSLQIRIRGMASPKKARAEPALANFRDSHVVVSGGSVTNRKRVVRFVEVYTISTDSWQDGPDLCEARGFHASCALGDFVYVSCGLAKD